MNTDKHGFFLDESFAQEVISMLFRIHSYLCPSVSIRGFNSFLGMSAISVLFPYKHEGIWGLN